MHQPEQLILLQPLELQSAVVQLQASPHQAARLLCTVLVELTSVPHPMLQ
jgi:hypothetical protein